MTDPVCGGADSSFSPAGAAACCGRPDLSPTPCFKNARSSSVSSVGRCSSVGILRLGFFLSDSSKRRFCLAFKRGILFLYPFSRELSLRGDRLRFTGTRPALFDRRLTIALFESAKDHGRHEFLLAVIVKFDNNSFVSAGHHRAETKFLVLDLSALIKIRHNYVGITPLRCCLPP